MSVVIHRRPFYLAGCMSPSCVPVHEEYSRIDLAAAGGDRSHRGSRRLRRLIRKILSESRSLCAAPKPHTFQYDAVSYSQNFDDGCHRCDDDYARFQHATRF